MRGRGAEERPRRSGAAAGEGRRRGGCRERARREAIAARPAAGGGGGIFGVFFSLKSTFVAAGAQKSLWGLAARSKIIPTPLNYALKGGERDQNSRGKGAAKSGEIKSVELQRVRDERPCALCWC